MEIWANLKPSTPFNSIFQDGRVPIVSVTPIVPREEGSPPCFVIDPSELTDGQLQQLGSMLFEKWQPECKSLEEAIAYIQDGLPVKVEWFHSFVSIKAVSINQLPPYWRNEQSGRLAAAIKAYIDRAANTEELTLVRDYFSQWINADCWTTDPNDEQIPTLRESIHAMTTQESLEQWQHQAFMAGIDPL